LVVELQYGSQTVLFVRKELSWSKNGAKTGAVILPDFLALLMYICWPLLVLFSSLKRAEDILCAISTFTRREKVVLFVYKIGIIRCKDTIPKSKKI
jgi:hypothetical protein